MDRESLVKIINENITMYLKANKIYSEIEISKLNRFIFDEISKEKNRKIKISSPNVVIEVIDENTGEMHRRYLDMEYNETDNGIRLVGENMSGNYSEIIFLSDVAINKIWDLNGAGIDKPICENK